MNSFHFYIKWFWNFVFAADTTSALVILKELTSLKQWRWFQSVDQRLYQVFLMMLGLAAISTWRERRWSRCHWWWRTQWGAPWCLRWDSAGPPSWSSCLSRCRRRSPCQSRSPPAAELRVAAPLLVNHITYTIDPEIDLQDSLWID